METQEDSIDIAHLKRLALGLAEEESQLQCGSRRCAVDDGTEKQTRYRQGQERNNVPGAHPANVYAGDTETTIKPLIFAGGEVSHLPPPRRRRHKMSQTQPSAQQELASAIPETLVGRVSPENSVPGDTQPVSPSVFESMIKRSKSPLESRDTQQEEYGDTGDGVTQLTLIEGDTGHLDLLDGFGAIQADENIQTDGGDTASNFGNSSPARFQPNQFPESQRFVNKTPATVKKRNQRDDVPAETPSLPVNPLARDGAPNSGGQTMALSQAFKATQAPSSPYANGLTSDLLSDRPSPNIPIRNRPTLASASSPLLGQSPALRTGTAEPQANYVSMKESQAMRHKLAEQRKIRSAGNINDDMSDDAFYKEDSLVLRRARQKAIREETRKQLIGVTAPARPQSKDKGKKSGVSEHPRNKATSHDDTGHEDTAQDDTVIVSDDNAEDSILATDNGAPSEEETEQEDDLDQPVGQPSKKPISSSEEDKENFDDSLTNGIDITSRAHSALSQVLELNQSPSVRRNIFANALPMATQQSTTRDENEQLPSRNSQDINVADSQPNRENSPAWQPSTLPSNLQTSSIALQYRPPKSQLERSRDGQHRSSSPVIRSPIPSSPPSRHDQDQKQDEPEPNSAGGSGKNVQQTNGNLEFHDGKCTNSSNVDKCGQEEADISVMMSEKKAKPQEDGAQVDSSLSRIYETPIHNNAHLQSFRNTIPETSPASQCDNVPIASAVEPLSSQKLYPTHPAPDNDNDNDNDMLPPPYTEAKQSHGTALQRSPAGRRLSQAATILSSPSGRQRRTLTQIASDPPPEDPFDDDVDIDIGLVTKDDNEFQSIVGASPTQTRPAKRRRVNDGKGIVTTRMVPIKPPCESTPATKPPDTRENWPGRSALGETDIQEIPVLRKSRPVNQSENIWDIEASPQKKAAPAKSLSRSRSSGNITSRRFRSSEPNNRSQRVSVAQGVVVPSRRSLQGKSTRKAESVSRDSPDPIQDDTPMSDRGAEQDTPTSAVPTNDIVVAPNQIFGCFNGGKRAYYPAVCLGTADSIGKSGYVIKFEDTDADEVGSNAVKRLELRIGDVVKVDMPDVPKVPHIVRGLKDKVDHTTTPQSNPHDPELPCQMTDVYGHSTVLLELKQRKSLPLNNTRTKLIAAPISKIYLDTVLWAQLKERKFTYTPDSRISVSHLGSPVSRYETPGPQTSRTNHTPFPTTGLFSGMLFAISYIGKEQIKSRVTNLIERNGGHILQDGFQELFRVAPSVPTATPSKSASRSKKASSESHFQLAPDAENFGFAALIADQHSRRAKYMQALALNIPCLSGKWVEDCIKRNEILDWEYYLLPAGESKLLHGAIRSRVMAPNPATTARFVDTIAARPKLLEGQSVLLVMGRGKAEEKRKAYLFLTYALGADKVERVLDLKSAKVALLQEIREQRGSEGSQHQSGWDWVYVDDGEEATAREMLPGVFNPKSTKARASVGKKRRRSERAESIASSFAESSGGNIRVVGNEFVCQSLILGKLFEE